MKATRLYESEFRILDLVWKHEPLPSGQLVKLCLEYYNWKKPTTYTVLRKMCDRGMVQNSHTIVTSLVSRQDICQQEGNILVKKLYGSSFAQFMAAYIDNNPNLSYDDIAQAETLLSAYRNR